MTDAIVFPPQHWTIEKLNAAVRLHDSVINTVQAPLVALFPPTIVSLVDGWMMLDIGNDRMRLFCRSGLVVEEKADSVMFDIVLASDWLPDARRMLLTEAGYGTCEVVDERTEVAG